MSGTTLILFVKASVLFSLLNSSLGYRPVIYLHGVLANGHEGSDFNAVVQKRHPGTDVTPIHMYQSVWSLLSPIQTQANSLAEKVTEITKEYPTDVHLVCYSQGGFVCRTMLQQMASHKIRNFITLSSPLAGQYGVTSVLERLFVPPWSREYAYRFFYSGLGQMIAVGNYWNDPYHQDILLDPSRQIFLAQINNQLPSLFNNSYAVNFPRVNHMVMVGGPNDSVITPWYSSHFGFYDKDLNEVPMESQPWFLNNSFGLKTLSDRGSLHVCVQSNVEHHHWYRNQTVFDECLEQWLD